VFDCEQKVVTVAKAEWTLKEVLRSGLRVNVRLL
jgi:hypothetical protein